MDIKKKKQVKQHMYIFISKRITVYVYVTMHRINEGRGWRRRGWSRYPKQAGRQLSRQLTPYFFITQQPVLAAYWKESIRIGFARPARSEEAGSDTQQIIPLSINSTCGPPAYHTSILRIPSRGPSRGRH
ncbi:PREDICTED: uncharacterized protein LOC105456584 [Wasmannia auropunctata]|uniref:uncharacterized protein LOC105456584 n=1 Tax=Wasmannia auropunctata TaxID=64793 RepID=UPI0005ED7432|nr:PREDICTED: uncharacterized protein LOC105456584 [Wasmannia auropunctata]